MYKRQIDTGMGLERLVALIQGGETNFDTDLFLPIIHATEELSGVPYEGKYKMAYRVIADHIRTLVFALSDGAGFSNSGRGYVLRRVLRRAVRFGLKLGLDEPFLYKLVPVVAENMKDFYPYLMDTIEKNQKLIRKEEETFKKTLKNGQALLDEEMAKAKDGRLDGEVVFKLYDTYGFPFEMTQEIAEENGLSVDREEFDACMAAQKERARNARNVEDSFAEQNEELMNFTEACEFTGYDNLEGEGKVIALFKDGHRVDSLEDEGQVILDNTVFYVQSGGQIADTGILETPTAKVRVLDGIKTRNSQHLHSVVVEEGILSEGDVVSEKVDEKRRKKTTANHSATHLLQSALKQVFGDDVHQMGSFVGPDYLRFDFNSSDKPTTEQLAQIEDLVNGMIDGAYPVTKEIMNIEEAKKTGAMALFNEKYGDQVRVVTMGDVSCEFCAGCHVDNTEEIGVFKISNEESIGSDTRRITAKTGKAAYEEFAQSQKMLQNIARFIKAKGLKQLDDKVENSVSQNRILQKEIEDLRNQIFTLKAKEWAGEAVSMGDLKVLIKKVKGLDGASLKDIAASLKGDHPDMVVFFASVNPESSKIVFVCGAGKDAVKKGIKAGVLVKAAANLCGGNGGGKPDLASAGGKDASKLDEAFDEVKAQIEQIAQA